VGRLIALHYSVMLYAIFMKSIRISLTELVMPCLDVYRIREDFPLLSSGVLYFDNAATSLTPKQVVEAIADYLLNCRANIGRGVYPLAQRATEAYEEVRAKVAKFIGAESCEVSFVKNTTEAINIVSMGVEWSKEDNVVITGLEHHSNMLPWLRASRIYGFEVRVVKPKPDGSLSLDDFAKAVDKRTRLVALTHVSNVLGTISPVREVARLAKDHGALVLVDAAQSAPHMPLNVEELGCDFLAFSAHKMCGPPGVGVLYVRRGVELRPMMVGGGVVADASLESFELVEKPQVFEAGTPPISGVVGLGAAIDYLSKIGLEDVWRHEVKLAEKLRRKLVEVEGVKVLGPEKPQTGITSFAVDGVSSDEVAMALGRMGVCVRSGFHCAIPLVRDVLGEEQGVVRASLYLYNTEEEVDSFMEILVEVLRLLRGA